jgi:hypothetical protein
MLEWLLKSKVNTLATTKHYKHWQWKAGWANLDDAMMMPHDVFF